MAEEKKISPEQEFSKKHTRKTPEEIKEQMKKGHEVRESLTKDLTNIERNLTNFPGSHLRLIYHPRSGL